jgi:predicted deacylase
MNVVACASDYSKPGLSDEALRLATAFGTDYVQVSPMVGGFPGPTSLAGYVGEHFGVPVIAAEVGGSGFDPDLEDAWELRNVEGVLNVMAALEMLDERVPPSTAELVGRAHRVSPTQAGMLEPVVPASRLMHPVSDGELLGTLWSPYTFDVVEELRAPCSGVLGMASAAGPVRPGHWAFIVFESS